MSDWIDLRGHSAQSQAVKTLLSLILIGTFALSAGAAEFQAGASIVDVTPEVFPVLVNGGMLSRESSNVKTPIHARAMVLDDGDTRLAIVVVDSCMMPRPLLDEAKALAASRTGIRADRMLISATHTHTAPASMGCLGTNADPVYQSLLVKRIAKCIALAEANLQPAKLGFAVGQAPEYTALRRWVRRPDKMLEDPFGNFTVRANMHPGYLSEEAIGESGPEDPDLSLFAIQSLDGDPIAVLANFSMHYYGDQPLSADYFGIFSDGLKERIAPDGEFVGMMSHGCSGDIYLRDYAQPEPKEKPHDIKSYAKGLLEIAMEAYDKVEYQADVDLEMAEARMTLNYRVPDRQLLEWSERIVGEMEGETPKNRTEVYAREQLILHERQSTEIVVQAIKLGDYSIATTPNETYALTGLKLKAFSPASYTMVIELANGGDGYIPPPEQHLLGGYNTWAARSAGLEIAAEPKIVEQALLLIEETRGEPRRDFRLSHGTLAKNLLAEKPLAYWRTDEMAGPRAFDSTPHRNDGIYEDGVIFYLEGPDSAGFCDKGQVNRSAHFAGGRLRANLPNLGQDYAVSLRIWNGMPKDARDVAGWMFSRGRDHGLGPIGDHLGIGGSAGNPGKLMFLSGDGKAIAGKTEIERWTWNEVRLERRADQVQVFLNGELEIETSAPVEFPPGFTQVFIGGRGDAVHNWEGKLDEIAIFSPAG